MLLERRTGAMESRPEKASIFAERAGGRWSRCSTPHSTCRRNSARSSSMRSVDADVTMRHRANANASSACERPVKCFPSWDSLPPRRYASLWEDEKPDDAPQLQAALAGVGTRSSVKPVAAARPIVYRARDLRPPNRLVALGGVCAPHSPNGPGAIWSRNGAHGRPTAFRTSCPSSTRARVPRTPLVHDALHRRRILRGSAAAWAAARRYAEAIADCCARSLMASITRTFVVWFTVILKPDNILLSGEHAIIADFGIAKAFERGDAWRCSQMPVPTMSSTRGMSVGGHTDLHVARSKPTSDPGGGPACRPICTRRNRV